MRLTIKHREIVESLVTGVLMVLRALAFAIFVGLLVHMFSEAFISDDDVRPVTQSLEQGSPPDGKGKRSEQRYHDPIPGSTD